MGTHNKVKSVLGAILALVILAASLGTSPAVGALRQDDANSQETKPLFSAEGVESRLLAQTTAGPISGNSPRLVLERITMVAGTTLQERTTASPEALVVEAGSVSLEDSFGFTSTVEENESLTINAGASYILINDGFFTTTILRLSIATQTASASEATPVSGSVGATPIGEIGNVARLVDQELLGLPEGELYLYLANATFAPGASSGEQAHSGPLAIYVDSGALAVQSPSGVIGELGEGQGVILPATAPLLASNETENEVNVLFAGVAFSESLPVEEVTPEPTPTNVPTPTVPPTPTPEPTPEPTSTPAPTLTPEPTPTPMPAAGTVLYEADTSGGFEEWSGAGGWQMVNGMLVNDGSAETAVFVGAPYEAPIANYAVEAEIQWARGSGTYGIVARQSDDGGYYGGYRIRCCIDAPADAVIWGAENDELGEEYLPLDNEWHTFRLEVNGNVVSFYLDGTLIIETPDNSFLNAGVVGIWSNGAQVSVRRFSVIALGEMSSADPEHSSAAEVEAAEGADLASLFPAEDVVGDGLSLLETRHRSLDEVVENYPDPAETRALFLDWGWQANAICSFGPVPAGAWEEGLLNGVYISIHQFDSPVHATNALDWSLVGQLEGSSLYEIPVPPYGDYARGLYGTLDYGNEVTLLVQKGNYLIRVSAASVGADPTAKAGNILESILAKV